MTSTATVPQKHRPTWVIANLLSQGPSTYPTFTNVERLRRAASAAYVSGFRVGAA